MSEREDRILACILAGFWLIKIKDCQGRQFKLKIKPLRKEYKPFLEDFFLESKDECIKNGYMDDNSYEEFLLENGVNTARLDKEIEDLKAFIEDLKVQAFDNFLDPISLNVIKLNIDNQKEQLSSLFSKRYQYYHMSAAGQAEIEKNKVSLALCSYWQSGKRLVKLKQYPLFPAYILDEIMAQLKIVKPTETEIRSIARGEAWSSLLNASRKGNLFKVSVADMLDEQITLINWSMMYQSIHKHPEKPLTSVVEDDIMLDGWLIKQRRKNDIENKQKSLDSSLNNSMDKYGEVFIPAKNEKMKENIYSLNTGKSKETVRKNFEYGK